MLPCRTSARRILIPVGVRPRYAEVELFADKAHRGDLDAAVQDIISIASQRSFFFLGRARFQLLPCLSYRPTGALGRGCGGRVCVLF